MVNDSDLRRVLLNAVRKSFNKFETIPSHSKTINKKRSAKFVTEIGEGIFKCYELQNPSYKLNFQKLNDENGTKEPGEWIYDIAITEQQSIFDPEKTTAEVKINSRLIWAIESEYNTGLDFFAQDFGKLLCANSENYLYLNGLNQDTKKNQDNYILRRLKIVSGLINSNACLKEKPFYYGFWVSPEKKGDKSLWGKFSLAELLEMARIFRYISDAQEFIKSDIHFREIL